MKGKFLLRRSILTSLIGLIIVIFVLGLVYFFSSNSLKPKDTALQIFNDCAGSAVKSQCYITKFGELSKNNPVPITLETLEDLKKLDSSVSYCHSIAHKIANAEVAKEPKNWMEVFEKVDLNACSRGFFHGILEGYTGFNPEFRLSSSSINNLCNELSENPKIVITGNTISRVCPHAAGHMLLVQENGNLDSSVGICKGTDSKFQFDCYIGIFMEYTVRDNLSEHGIAKKVFWDKANIAELKNICLENQENKAESACWEGIMPALANVYYSEPSSLKTFCESLPKGDKQNCLFKGTGEIALLQKDSSLKQNLLNLCGNFTEVEAEYKTCLSGVNFYIVSTRPEQLPELVLFCQNTANNLSQFCFGKIAENVQKYFTSQKQQMLCKTENENIKTFCRENLKII